MTIELLEPRTASRPVRLPVPPGVPALVLVGPMPPHYAGQSVSFKMLVEDVASRGLPHTVVDIANGPGTHTRPNQASARRAWEYLRILARYFRAAAPPHRTVYLTIAQSRHGFLRDAVMIWFARARGHQVVAHLKGGNYDGFYAAQGRALRWAIRATLRQVDRIVVLAEPLREMYAFDPGLAARVRVVSNGHSEHADPGVGGKRLPYGHEPVRLLFLSNLIESKGWLEVLEAVRLLRDRYGRDEVRCDFYGDFQTNPGEDVRVVSVPQARRLFDGFVREHGLAGVVAWHGAVSGRAKCEALRRAHIFVLPTRYRNEGQPVSIIEAMAYGNVVVSTPYRAIPELVEHGVTGLLVPGGQPAALAAVIAGLLADPEAYASLSRRAVARFRDRFTRQAHLEALLGELLPSHGTAPAVG